MVGAMKIAMAAGAAAMLAASPALAQEARKDTVLKVESSDQFGEYLVDGDGRPVYLFTPDTQAQGDGKPVSTCFDDCANAWPPVLVDNVSTEGEAKADLASKFERQTGEVQATYNGWPLYYFVQDEAGQPPQGQDRHGFGGEWYLLTPSGEKVGES